MGNRKISCVTGTGILHKVLRGMYGVLFAGCIGLLHPGCDVGTNASEEVHSTPEGCWLEDDLPSGASWDGQSESFTWVENPHYSGNRAHQSKDSTGVHQHFFDNASPALSIGSGATLYTYVYLDPESTPEEVMLQWYNGNTWLRAYWGSDKIEWEGKYMGALPAKGKWVKLSVSADEVGLKNSTIKGWAFTLYGGKATWDASGVE